jgi:hypothetical protein
MPARQQVNHCQTQLERAMVTIQPTVRTNASNISATATPLFYGAAGWLAIAAGTLIVIGQAIWWPFDQQGNVATSQNNIFNAGSVLYLAGFCVLMFALIAVHGRQAHRAGRLGTFGFSAAILGTMMLGGDLWFESFAVPWLAEGPLPAVLQSTPSILFALGALSSYWLFAIGWVAFGVASLRARVFPVWISIFIVVGGIAGYQALLAPWGIPLGLAIATLGVWLLRRPRSSATTESLDERAATAVVWGALVSPDSDPVLARPTSRRATRSVHGLESSELGLTCSLSTL